MSRPMPATGRPDAEPGWEHFAHDADMGVRGFGRRPIVPSSRRRWR